LSKDGGFDLPGVRQSQLMNERQRFLNLFRGEPVDRPPLLEEGVRDEVLERWRTQGLPAGKTHLEIFGLTPHENVGPDLTFSERYAGEIISLSERDYRCAFHASRERFPEDWPETAKRLESRSHVACIWAYRGLFQALGVEDWPTLRQVLRGLVRSPALVRSHMEMYGEFCAAMLKMAMRDVTPDFIYLSEPISDNRSPLISPAMYQEFAIPAFRKIIAAARAHGCENILVSTYGNSAALLPSMLEAGVNMLWISEAAEVPELDYRSLRHKYGTHLGLIAGVPLSILRMRPTEGMEERLRAIVCPLLRTGRYIPLAGGRVREHIPWAAYQSYREALAEIIAETR
jgi:hypothetical protein